MTTRPSKPAPNLLTAEQHQLFDEYVKTWQVRLGLQGWRIERSRRKTKHMSEVAIHHKDRLAVYRVGDFGAQEITPMSIEATVVHELLHIVLFGLVNQVPIELSGLALEAEEHGAIHMLERLLMASKPTP